MNRTAAIVVLGAVYVALALLGDVGLALWAERRVPPLGLALAMLVHGVASATWALQMRQGVGFGRSAAVLILANLAGAVFLARFAFHEALTRSHMAGIVAAVVAIVLLA